MTEDQIATLRAAAEFHLSNLPLNYIIPQWGSIAQSAAGNHFFVEIVVELTPADLTAYVNANFPVDKTATPE